MTSANISTLILANISNGLSLEAAIDAVFGEGSYTQIAGDIYEALRAKA